MTFTDKDRAYRTQLYDDTVPLPTQAKVELTAQNARLVELREAYAKLDLPVVHPSRWHRPAVDNFLDLRWFRGETLFVWHYRELLPRVDELKYFVYARAVRDSDTLGLFERLEEDGAFGCFAYSYPGWGRVSRDLLQSIAEISFLERELALSDYQALRVLDIGAGYGRLAHRMTSALPNVKDYCCVDVVPEATFLSEWYLGYRQCLPPARVVRLDHLEEELQPGGFDLAVNMHSFSECPLAAIQWWVDRLSRLDVPHLLLIPNEPETLLSTETDGSRRDFAPIFASAGYELRCREPLISEPASRELIPLRDAFYLFARK